MDRKDMKETRQFNRPARKGKWIVIIPVVVMFLGLSLQAQAMPAGSGTEADPYQIGTFDDLLWIANNSASWSSYFVQTADIDASQTQTFVWPRIGGSYASPFAGSYDGQNFVIDGLHLEYNQSIYDMYWGLFGVIGASGRVSNLGVVNLVYTEKAGLPAYYHGGLAGTNLGLISNCYSTGTITTPNSTYGGGLVGGNALDGIISRSYSTCTVIAGDTAGGLTGYNTGDIDNSFATGSVSGNVSGTSPRGGLTGSHSQGTISNCYSTGAVSGGSSPGGLCGTSSDTITNCFWNVETSGMATSAGGTGLTTAQMQTQMIFTDAGWDFDQESANGTDDIWGMNPTDNDGFPFLSIQGYTSYGQPPAGSGSAGDPYLIASLENLYWLSQTKSVWGGHFKQTADIDAATTSTWADSQGFSPIGSSTSNFTGTYDGQNFKIVSLTINRPAEDHVGLFGYTSGSAAISNLVLQNPTITGNADVGAFVGTGGDLSIDNCASTGGSVTGNGGNIGGLVGNCSGALAMTDTSATDGSVTGNGDNVGGLVGNSAGPLSMTGVHTTGSVTQDPLALSSGTGGLVGRTGSGSTATVSNCYSTATVQGYQDIGGLVGYLPSGSIAGSFYSTGTVSSSYYYRGGLVGRAGTLEISDSYSSGNIAALTDNAYFAGGLVGYVDTITISQSHSTGTISGGVRDSNGYLISGPFHGGGLVGMIYSSGDITNCYSEATIEVRGKGGGLVGDMRSGSITNSYYRTGTVSSNERTGGLVGIATNVTISQSYSTGHVGGGVDAGGLVGAAFGGSITDCYSTGNITPASSQVWDYGGFVGYNTATITNCYSTGAVPSGFANVGGFVYNNSGTITHCFWDTQTSGMTTSTAGTGKTTAEMKTASTFTDAGWDFNTIWQIDGQNNSGYPCFRWRFPPVSNLIDWNGNLVADFGDNGLWYNDGTAWNWMTNTGHVGQMVVWNGKLVVDFGTGKGLWYYDTSWHWMTNNSNPNMMIAWNNGTSEKLVVDYGSGNRIYTYDGAWNWFTNKDGVAGMTVWNNKLVVDFGSGRGMYNYDTSWHWMTNKDDVNLMLPWDNGTTERLVVDFGTGRRIYTYDGSWSWFINKDGVNDMAVWNQKLVVDFGGGRYLYNYDTSWHWMNNKDDVAGMASWNDGGSDKLAVDFGSGRGLYYYDGSWNWMKNDSDVPGMTAWNNRLAVDFGPGVGLYYYDGAWHRLKSWSTAE